MRNPSALHTAWRIVTVPFRAIVAPGVALVGLLRVWQKFLLVGLLLVGAVAYVGQAFREQQHAQVAFSAKEIDGVDYVVPALKLVDALADARTAAVRQAVGDEAAGAQLDEAMARAREVGKELDAVEARLGDSLETSKLWEPIKADLDAPPAPASGPETLEAWDARVAAGVALVTQAGNISNLILDPDLDSYYVMDAIVVREPILLDTSGRIAALDALLGSEEGDAALQRRIDLAVARGVLESNHAAVVGGLQTAYDKTADTSLNPLLEPPAAALATAVEATSGAIDATVAGGDAGTADAAALGANDAALALVDPLGQGMDTLLETRVAKLQKHQDDVERIALIAVLVALYLFVCFYVALARASSSMVRALDRVSAGDLSGRSNQRTHDEIGRMSRALDQTLDSVQETVDAIAVTARTVNDASRELAGSSERGGRAMSEIGDAINDIAGGAERQVNAVYAARSAADEANAAAAGGTEAASRARDDAAAGVQAAAEAVAAMRAVEAASVRIDGITNELGQRSAAIGGIVDSILSIAEQTNLLALNAAIEAARAGEAGRGFAVVAGEVRELAEESRGAAGEIASLVREIEQGIGRAVEAAAESSAQVAEGVETVERATAMLERINAASDDVVGRLSRIEQGTSTVAGALGDVSEVAETTSAAAEQAAASSDEARDDVGRMAGSAGDLARTAAELDALAGRFRPAE
jgi:methyl-accepting chemotaxis protein